MKRRNRRNVLDWPVMKQQCATCPFGPKGDPMVHAGVVQRSANFQGSQICHHPRLHDKPETSLPMEAFDAKWQELQKGGVE